MKLARCSFGAPYQCLKEWPESCGVQAGNQGIVFSQKADSYLTAFFEAFPKDPNCNTFIRGEGKTVVEAEASAFAQYQKFSQCSHASGFERRAYTNGAGFCKDCGMFKSKAFEPSTLCVVCGTPTNWGTDKHDAHYCKDHSVLIKDADKSWMQLKIEQMNKDMQTFREKKATHETD